MDTLLVGSEVPRVDGLARVTGKAVYGDDIVMNDMLYGVCRYVDIPAGRIDALDLSEAEKVPGSCASPPGMISPASATGGDCCGSSADYRQGDRLPR
jgi:CO/xanthine dehydrogenase Mo-binding subunit